MDKWKVIQVGGAAVLVFVIGSEALKDPATDESHSHKESQNGPDQQIGRAAVDMAVSTGNLPFVTSMDGNEFRRYRPYASAYYFSQGETATPLPLWFS